LAAEAPAMFKTVWAWADTATPAIDASAARIAMDVFIDLI
jgi:hypothetical protein